MSDLIDRQAAIAELYDVFFDDDLKAAYPDKADVVLDVIRKMPSAQPDEKRTEERTKTHACDLISRQAAIDALMTWEEGSVWDEECLRHRGEPYWVAPSDVIEKLPSAQQWIPCSERLPEEYGMYLVTMMEKAKAEDFGFDVDDIEVRKMRYNSNGWQIPRHIPTWINNVITDEVIAWMPLLTPYTERREE